MGKKRERRKLAPEQMDVATAKRLEELLSDRVGILNDLVKKRLALGHYKKALAATEEALGLSQILVKISPALYLHDLAATLSNLGNCYRLLSRHEEALAMMAKAVKHLKQLSEESPEDFLPVLAASLNNLGICYNDCKRKEEALVVVEESVRIYRTLMEKETGTYLFGLEGSLRNLGYCYGVLHREQEALMALTEAGVRVVCYNHLNRRPELPRALATLADMWRQKGNHATADQLEKEVASMRGDRMSEKKRK